MIFTAPGDPLHPEKPEIERPTQPTPGAPDSGRAPERPDPGAEPSLPVPPQPGNPEYPRYSAPPDQGYLFRDMNF